MTSYKTPDGPIEDRGVWWADEIGGKDGLTREIDAQQCGILRDIVEQTRQMPPEGIRHVEFEHPRITALMEDVRRELMDGSGAVVLAGLDASTLTLDEFSRIYWGLATYLGNAAPQSPAGDRIGHVKKDDYNPTGRGYLKDIELRPHTDFHEVMGLAAYQRAAEGGNTGLASSLTIHNLLLDEQPSRLKALYEGFFETEPGTSKILPDKAPMYWNVRGVVSCYFHNFLYDSAAAKLGVELPVELVEAQQLVLSIARRPEVRLQFRLEPGEILFWHNFKILHSRGAFRDTPERKRLLLRLWLNVKNGRAMHPSFNARARALDRVHEAGRAAIDYVGAG
ncbi:MAG: TauD/TfdA family dioxygenase [Chloroflexi bacterium]|nr:TauD/TfdA family dioxygenase [Chloroflexota bacterium]